MRIHPLTKQSLRQTIPTSYLLCEDDKVVPSQGQEGVIQRASDAGATIEVTRIVSGHSPFLSMVEETVEWVRGVCGEDVGKK
jgi:predicted esterase